MAVEVPHGHISAICVLSNPFILTTSCQVPHEHVITISDLPCGLHRKSNGEDSREGLKLLSPAERTPSSLWGLTEKDLRQNPGRIFSHRAVKRVSPL